MKKSKGSKKNRNRGWLILMLAVLLSLLIGRTALASEDQIINVLKTNQDLFQCNNIFLSLLRIFAWGAIHGLAWLAVQCADLFDLCFTLIDFTNWPAVKDYIASYQPVFVALVCLSLVFLGVILIFDHDKKPKIVINICIAIAVVTSMTHIIGVMNNFLATDIRGAVISGDEDGGTEDLIYETIGASLYDLLYLDDKVGLMNLKKDNRVTYDTLTEEERALIDINEIVKEDDVKSESKDLVQNRIAFKKDNIGLEEIYNGVAWTDLLNEYYYRYHVDWFVCIIGLVALILVYLCLAYKVVRIIYEIAIHELLAVLYSSNLSNHQKTVKILEGIKDSYITLILVMVCMKFYLLAYKYVNTLGVNQFSKCMILLFLAFAVVDGPNMIQKLTGIDAGLSSGVGKLIAAGHAARLAGHAAGGVWNKASELLKGDPERQREKMEQMRERMGLDPGREGLKQDTDVKDEKSGMPAERNGTEGSGINMSDQKEPLQGDATMSGDAVPEQESGEEWRTSGEGEAGALEGSGYEEERSADAVDGVQEPEMGGLNHVADDLNGFDPLSGDVNSGLDSMKQMEQELGRPDTQERRLQKEPLSSSSMMFREDRENRKEMKAKDRTQLDGKYDLEDRT